MRSGIRSACPLALVVWIALVACSDSNAPVAPSAIPRATSLEPSSQMVWSDWSVPENLGPVINTGSAEQHPTISKDGLSLYFASDRTGTMGGLDLWVSRRASVDDPWGAPENLGPNINSTAVDLAPAFTRDGHWMYYHSAGRGGCGGPDLFVSRRHDKRDDLGWEVGENLGCVVNSSAEDAGPTLWTDDSGVTTMLFNSSRPGGPGELDIYQTTRPGDDGEWSPPTLVAELSGPFRDTRTTISRNKLTLFISSDSRNRIGGFGGQDLWMSTRIDEGSPWSTPVNLGSIVNGATFDGAPSLSWDGTELYFFSDRTTGGFGRNDLYVTRRSRVHP